jgi:ubiquitin C-terminal hydrolase
MSDNDEHKEKGVVGLVNLGNTCYANSVIQTLRSIPAFTLLLLSGKLKANEAASDHLKQFMNAFHKLIKQLWENHRGSALKPTGYIKSICELTTGTVYEQFSMNIPNDAHEYYVYILDRLQVASFKEPTLPENISVSETAWYNSFKKDYSKLVPLFYGQIKKTIHCNKCENETHTYEVFNSIKINLKDNGLPLIQSIQDYYKDEVIDGYQCDNCNSKTDANIIQKIIKTPPYLCITINRFAHGFETGHKDNRNFTLENDFLDLENIVANDTNEKYSLISMIDHHGSSRGGHYICHIKHVPGSDITIVDNGPKPGQWYLYDDESVYESSNAHLSGATYMMFFRRL